MSRVQIFKMDRDKSFIIHKILGGLFLIGGIILLWPYFVHFFKIFLAVILIFAGVYFLSKNTMFRWFRIRRF